MIRWAIILFVINAVTACGEYGLRIPDAERLNRALDTIANNKMTLNITGFDETKMLPGFYRVANRITVGLILSALILGASILMRIESRFTLFGYPGLAMIFFLVGAVGGIMLVWRILFGSEKE